MRKKGEVKRIPKTEDWPPISIRIKEKMKEKGGVYAVAMRNKKKGDGGIYKGMDSADNSIRKINTLLKLIKCKLRYEIVPIESKTKPKK